jgi:hypothetical protein
MSKSSDERFKDTVRSGAERVAEGAREGADAVARGARQVAERARERPLQTSTVLLLIAAGAFGAWLVSRRHSN